MSWRTNWTVWGKWADTGDLDGLASFSLHRVTRMPGEPVGTRSSVSIGKGRWSDENMAAGEVYDTVGRCKVLVSNC